MAENENEEQEQRRLEIPEEKDSAREDISTKRTSDPLDDSPSIFNLPDLEGSFLTRDVITLQVSFETGEQTTHKVRVPYECLVKHISTQVTKAIAGSTNATITLKNNGGTSMENGVVTITAASALGTLDSATPTKHNSIPRNGYIQLTAIKPTTAGGRVRAEIEIEKVIT